MEGLKFRLRNQRGGSSFWEISGLSAASQTMGILQGSKGERDNPRIRGFWEFEEVEDFDFLPLLGLEGQKSYGNEFPCVYPWIIFLGI